MAIKPGYKSFTFDGKNSGNYGIYITGSAVYNAPARDVEMISIPGRSGAFVQDNGRFENIEVTYPAGIYAESQEDFAQALSDLRNMLASRKGYCRLTDEYNPEEYRMAVYKSGLDVDPVAFQRAGEFEITFDCKPQRYLTSGEEAIEVTSGDRLTNPTLFESKPLLEIEGYGTVTCNNAEFEILNTTLGYIRLAKGTTGAQALTELFHTDFVKANDIITVKDAAIVLEIQFEKAIDISTISVTLPGTIPATLYYQVVDERNIIVNIKFTDVDFSATKTVTTTTYSETIIISATATDSTTGSVTVPVAIAYEDNASYNRDQVSFEARPTVSGIVQYVRPSTSISSIYADSSVTTGSLKLYIDSETGEAYSRIGSQIVDRNSTITGLFDLPFLSPGGNLIVYTFLTITSFKITPRWWKV